MPHPKHYLAIFSKFGKPANQAQRVYLELLGYFDDRCWPIKVWYHDRLPQWVSRNRVLANLLYLVRLLCTPASTVIIDCSLYPFLAACLLPIRLFSSHRLLISVWKKYQPAVSSFWKDRFLHHCWCFCLKQADRILVDSKATFVEMMALGIPPTKLTILPLTNFIPFSSEWIYSHPLPEIMPPLYEQPIDSWKKVRKRLGNLIEMVIR